MNEIFVDIYSIIAACLLKKFPNTFSKHNSIHSDRTIFEVIRMMLDEIYKKNLDLFTKPHLDKLVNIKNMQFKDGLDTKWEFWINQAPT